MTISKKASIRTTSPQQDGAGAKAIQGHVKARGQPQQARRDAR
jgi:hypothetical protein